MRRIGTRTRSGTWACTPLPGEHSKHSWTCWILVYMASIMFYFSVWNILASFLPPCSFILIRMLWLLECSISFLALHKNYYKHRSLKQHSFISSKFYKSEVQVQPGWILLWVSYKTEIKVSASYVLIWSSEPSSKLIQSVDRHQFFADVGSNTCSLVYCQANS